MSDRTPGPWAVEQDGDYCNVLYRCDGQDEANAHLISAAPELLASLEAITARHAPNSDFMGDDEFAEFTRARAVIAKATGGTK